MTLGAGTIFLGGLLTFASPCVLPLIPIYLSVLLGSSVDDISGARARWTLFRNGALFVTGFLLVFVLMGLTASAAGRFLVGHRLLFQQLGGLVVFLFGLKFLGIVRLDLLNAEKRFNFGLGGDKGMSAAGAVLIGFTFAFGWTPCIGPILGSVLTFTAVTTGDLGTGALYLLLYGLGIGLPLLLVALFAQQGVKLLNRIQRFLPKLEKATGAVLVIVAVLMVTDHVGILTFASAEGSSATISQEIVAKTGAGKGVAVVEKAVPTPASPPADAGNLSCESEESCELTDDGFQFQLDPVAIDDLKKGPVALYFHKPDCPACLKMVPTMQALTESCVGEGLGVTKIDISVPENRQLALQMGVRGTPTLAFFDNDGGEISRLIGYQDQDTVERAAAVLMGEVCAEFSRFPS